MKTSTTLVLMTGLLFVNQAQGSFLDRSERLREAISEQIDQSKSHQVTAARCTDFSGMWKGQCIDDEEDTPYYSEMNLDQRGCEVLQMGDVNLHIGGITSVTESPSPNGPSKNMPLVFADSLSWNDSQTELKSIVSVASGFGGISFSASLLSTFRLIDDKLVVKDQKSTSLTNTGGTIDIVKQTCTYVKIPQ